MEAVVEMEETLASQHLPQSASDLLATTLEFNGHSISVPLDLMDSEVFFEFISNLKPTDLSSSGRQRLMTLLPQSAEVSSETFEHYFHKILDQRRSGKLSRFGTPVEKFYKLLQAGRFRSDRVTLLNEIKGCEKLQRQIKHREYYTQLLKNLLMQRRKILVAAKKCRDFKDLRIEPLRDFKREATANKIQNRAKNRAKLILTSIKYQINDNSLSSDDDNDDNFSNQDDCVTSILHAEQNSKIFNNAGTTNLNKKDYSPENFPHSTLHRPDFLDFDMHQPTKTPDIKHMILEYRALKRSQHSDHPSLDFSDITLENIVDRVGFVQQPPKTTKKSHHSVGQAKK